MSKRFIIFLLLLGLIVGGLFLVNRFSLQRRILTSKATAYMPPSFKTYLTFNRYDGTTNGDQFYNGNQNTQKSVQLLANIDYMVCIMENTNSTNTFHLSAMGAIMEQMGGRKNCWKVRYAKVGDSYKLVGTVTPIINGIRSTMKTEEMIAHVGYNSFSIRAYFQVSEHDPIGSYVVYDGELNMSNKVTLKTDQDYRICVRHTDEVISVDTETSDSINSFILSATGANKTKRINYDSRTGIFGCWSVQYIEKKKYTISGAYLRKVTGVIEKIAVPDLIVTVID